MQTGRFQQGVIQGPIQESIGQEGLEIAGPQNAHELIRAWSFEPGVVIPIFLSGLLYGIGTARLRKARTQ